MDNFTENDSRLHKLCDLVESRSKTERENDPDLEDTEIQEEEASVKIKDLLSSGVDPNPRNNLYQTPLHRLIYSSNPTVSFKAEMIACFLEAGANPNLIDNSGRPPLHAMVLKEPPATVQLVMSRLPQNFTINSVLDARSGTLLHAVAMSGIEGRAPLVKLLVDAGIDVNRRDSCGRTALHFACYPRWGKLLDGRTIVWDGGVLSELLDHGADVMATDNAGRIPLHYLFIPPRYYNKDYVTDFFSGDYLGVETAAKIANLIDSKNRNCWNFPDKNGRSPLFSLALLSGMSERFSFGKESGTHSDNLGISAENVAGTFGLNFYSFVETLGCPFKNLQFKRHGKIHNDKDKLSTWADQTRMMYSNPDILVARILETPAVGPPSLLVQSNEVHEELQELMTRLTTNTKDIYPGVSEVELVGSCRDGTKSSLPDEIDFRVKVNLSHECQAQVSYLCTDHDGNDIYKVRVLQRDSENVGRREESVDGDAVAVNSRKIVIDFMDVIVRALSDRQTWGGLKLCLCDVTWGKRALTFILEWTGPRLYEMRISVDIVLMLNIPGNNISFDPHPDKTGLIPAVIQAEQRAIGWNVLCTPIGSSHVLSFSELECTVFNNVPRVIRLGFTLAKTFAGGLLSIGWVSAAGVSCKPTSFLLKMSLFDLLDPERSFFLLDSHKCTAKWGTISHESSCSPSEVRRWIVRIYQNLRQQLQQTQHDRASQTYGKVRCYFLRDNIEIADSSLVVCFCDAILTLLLDKEHTHKKDNPNLPNSEVGVAKLVQPSRIYTVLETSIRQQNYKEVNVYGPHDLREVSLFFNV